MGKKAIVFSGSGMRIPFHAGAAMALHDKYGPFDGYFGTSGGGIMADLLAHGTAKEAHDAVLTIKRGTDLWALNPWWGRGLLSPAPLKRMLARYREGKRAHTPATVGLVNFYTGAITYLETSNQTYNVDGHMTGIMPFAEMAHVTGSIPGLIEPGHDPFTNEACWGDAGLLEMTPLKHAINRGFDELFVVMAYAPTPLPEVWKESMPFEVNYLLRSLDLLLHRRLLVDVEVYKNRKLLPDDRDVKITMIAAPENLDLGMFDFHEEKWQKAAEVGYNQVLLSSSL